MSVLVFPAPLAEYALGLLKTSAMWHKGCDRFSRMLTDGVEAEFLLSRARGIVSPHLVKG
jgi:hypothetical protein